ncbi:aldo/keto reductase [Paenibacillus solisilvae]|uniref:Aldo/keto reductase n=1 Tax=Paenibacillus solisilvae TaxID=2486751 RepID=A0ABW0VVI4_9BACL
MALIVLGQNYSHLYAISELSQKTLVTENYLEKILLQIQAIAHELDITVGQLSLAWILRQPNVSSALVGASRPEKVEENVKASGIVLDESDVKRIADIIENDSVPSRV